MKKLTRLVMVATILLGCVGCDQLTKDLAREHLSHAPTASFLHDMVRLTSAENPGAFLSLGAALSKPARMVIFQGGVGLVVVALIWAALLRRGLTRPQIVALALLGASGLGNLIDRVLYDGSVTDFLNIGIGPVRTGIFNVADIAGVVGVLVFLVYRGTAPERHHEDPRPRS